MSVIVLTYTEHATALFACTCQKVLLKVLVL